MTASTPRSRPLGAPEGRVSASNPVGVADPASKEDGAGPSRTRAALLAAARAEFVAHGLGGASVNEIAARAGINKRMIYVHFGSKDDLWLAVLEDTYAAIRGAERTLELDHLPPLAAVERLVRFTWDHFVAHPEFLTLLGIENMQGARHLRRSPRVREMHSPLVGLLEGVLARGGASGALRGGVDAVQLYISIAALGFFYLSNRYTLGTIFGRDLSSPEALAARADHAVEMVMGYLRPDEAVDSRGGAPLP